MTEINDQRPIKTSGFATASIVLGILAVISFGLTSLPGLILGIISIVQIRRRKGSLGGWSYALWGTTISVIMLGVFIFFCIAQISVSNSRRTVMCSSNMKQIGYAMMMYMEENDSCLPPSDKWVESLEVYMKSEHILRCPSATEDGISYAMNKSLSGKRGDQISDQPKTVLLFDSMQNDNPNGGPELIPLPERHIRFTRSDFPLDDTIELPDKDARYVKVNNICFTDLHVKSVTRGMVHTLIWNPVKK